MSLCDFAITRAGASTLSELVSLKIPFLAIPFPFSKDDHQYFNAKFYVDKNFGWLINEHEIFENYFYQFYEKNIHNKQMLDNKVEKMSNFIFEGAWSENLNMIEQTFYENYGRQVLESEKWTPKVANRRRMAHVMHIISP